ncbi:MAG TPA: 1,4-dihydroxy-2-naphthoate polyprenyltransferase [Chlamydiales bacterium]|nr:1,4-dihydroxy-2-naphthoate polyprenyltransferase [Chlamydiales bacterium]
MHSMKNGNPISLASPSGLKMLTPSKAYFLAARPKTFSAGICPVIIGMSFVSKIAWETLFLTLLFSLLIQIGTNYANDYFDFVKGADTEERKGPRRAVQQGWITPQNMLFASTLSFLAAFGCAIPLMIQAGLWSFAITILCILFGVLYTGGPKPLGYAGFGELLVFIFYGPVATLGTYFLQMGEITSSVMIASLAPGFLSSAILMANNLRDEETDRKAKKRTLVVRFGSTFGKCLYVFFIFSAFLVPVFFAFPLKLLCPLMLIFTPFWNIFRNKEALQATSLSLLLYTIIFYYGQCGYTETT